ncbi:MAG: hypothetical protein ACREO1_01200 [Arenimonas sp.]
MKCMRPRLLSFYFGNVGVCIGDFGIRILPGLAIVLAGFLACIGNVTGGVGSSFLAASQQQRGNGGGK